MNRSDFYAERQETWEREIEWVSERQSQWERRVGHRIVHSIHNFYFDISSNIFGLFVFIIQFLWLEFQYLHRIACDMFHFICTAKQFDVDAIFGCRHKRAFTIKLCAKYSKSNIWLNCCHLRVKRQPFPSAGIYFFFVQIIQICDSRNGYFQLFFSIQISSSVWRDIFLRSTQIHKKKNVFRNIGDEFYYNMFDFAITNCDSNLYVLIF